MKSSVQGILTGAPFLFILDCALGVSVRTATAAELGPDAFGYRAEDAPFVFEDLSGSGTRVLVNTADSSVSAPLGFTFNFYGVDYTSVSFSTNALLTFGGTNDEADNVSLAVAAPGGNLPGIAVLWDDWQFTQPGSDAAYFETRGAPGSRRFLVQWNLMFGAPTSPSNVVLEATLFEGTNEILFSFPDVDTATEQSFGATATVGIRDVDGHTNGRNLEWSHNSPTIMTRQAIRFFVPQDATPPEVSFSSPADGAVLGSTEALISAVVVDENPTVVVSVPSGLSDSLPAGGGEVSGNVALTEGSNTITISATDAAGNVGGASITVIRDTLPPAVSLVSPVDGSLVGDSPVTLVLDVRDDTASTLSIGASRVTIPAGGGSANVTVDLVEGMNSVEIAAIDAAGNIFSRTATLLLDLSTPLVTIDSPADGAFFGAGESPVAVVVTVNDASPTRVESTPSGVTASLPAGGGIAVGSVHLVEGPNVLTVQASDPTGRSGSGSIVVHLDTTAPSIALDSPPAGLALRGEVEVSASAADAAPGSGVARVEFRLDGGLVGFAEAEPFRVLLDTSLFADGRHTLSASAIDRERNSAEVVLDALIDNNPPVIAFSAPSNGVVVAGMLAFSIGASDVRSGLTLVHVLVEGQPPTVDPSASFSPAVSGVGLNGEVDTTLWPDGALSLTALAVDAAGNERLATVQVMVHNAPPVALTITPVDRSVVSGVITISVQAAHFDGGTISLHLDGALVKEGTTSPLTFQLDTTSRADGPLVIRAVARDTAGHETSASSTVTVDNVAITMRLAPTVLHIGSARRCGHHGWGDENGLVIARLEGEGLTGLLPVKRHGVELRVAGGSPVRALGALHTKKYRWRRINIPERLHVGFDRRSLISSIRAGIASGSIDPRDEVEVALHADGSRVATAFIRVVYR